MEISAENPTAGSIASNGSTHQLERTSTEAQLVNVTGGASSQLPDWRADRAARKALQDEGEPPITYPEPTVVQPRITQSKIHACATRCCPAVTIVASGVLGGCSYLFDDPCLKFTLIGAGCAGAAISSCWGCTVVGEIYRDVTRPNGQRKWIIREQARAINEMQRRLKNLIQGRRSDSLLLQSYEAFVRNGGLFWPYRVERFLSEMRGGMRGHEQNWKLMRTSVITEWEDLSKQRKRLGMLKKLVCDAAEVNCRKKEEFTKAIREWDLREGKEDIEDPFNYPTGSAGKWFRLYQMYDKEHRRVKDCFNTALALRKKVKERCALKGEDEHIVPCESEIKDLIREMEQKLDALKGAAKEQVVEEGVDAGDLVSEESDPEVKVAPYEEPGFWQSVTDYVKFSLWK